jgi:hypothetical protein
MKIGLCLIIKNETDYLDEWLNYHRNIGIDFFIIYDNQSDEKISINSDDIIINYWDDNQIGSQMRAYQHCCSNYHHLDYIGFIDTDEFYQSKTMDIKKDFNNLKKSFGEFSGLGLYWRMYGKFNPYIENRILINDYQYYYQDNHIKSFIDPKKVINFPDPHKPIINGKYIDEKGCEIKGPTGNHNSENIWIKHTWTRSLNEFKTKILRGSGDKVKRNYSLSDFYNYNDKCNLLSNH